MQDLLNEEEFVVIKEKTLWQSYKAYYIIALIIPLLAFGLSALTALSDSPEPGMGMGLSTLLFLLLPFILVFTSKSNINIKYKTLVKALSKLGFFFFLILAPLQLFSDYILSLYPEEGAAHHLGSAIGYGLGIQLVVFVEANIIFLIILLIRLLKKIVNSN